MKTMKGGVGYWVDVSAYKKNMDLYGGYEVVVSNTMFARWIGMQVNVTISPIAEEDFSQKL